MATTTSNFSWPIPQSTDLVKDGATAIASLGSGIDTSMVDLKGGTTGQILSKTSGTDMDFTWITPNPGDITGVTAGTGLTGGGTSGSVTLDFDVANYGGGQKAAGKNAVINGGFDIWQRGTSITTSGAYTADRWGQVSGVSATFSRSTDVPSDQGFTYSMSMAGTGPNLNQRIESLNAAVFAGQTVTLSFWYKSTVGSDNLNIQLWYANSTDNFASLTQIGSTQTISSPATSWTRYTYTYTNISANAINGLSFYIYRGNSATSTTLLTGVQLELGSTATPFSRAGGTIQGELAACQRYYVRYTDTGSAYSQLSPIGSCSATTQANVAIPALVQMRTTPSAVEWANIRWSDLGAGYAPSAVVLNGNCNNKMLTVDLTITGATQYRPGWIQQNNNTAGYIAFTAEL